MEKICVVEGCTDKAGNKMMLASIDGKPIKVFFCDKHKADMTGTVPFSIGCKTPDKEKPTIKPVVQKKPYKPEIGDILSGGEYLVKKISNKDRLGPFIFSTTISRNPWESLRQMGIDVDPLIKVFKYECPYTNNIYFHFIPAAILLENKNKAKVYRKPPLDDKSWDFMFNVDWINDNLLRGAHPELDPISLSMMGHGYTKGTLPTDGNGGFIETLIELDSGDHIFGLCWEWYNK